MYKDYKKFYFMVLALNKKKICTSCNSIACNSTGLKYIL